MPWERMFSTASSTPGRGDPADRMKEILERRHQRGLSAGGAATPSSTSASAGSAGSAGAGHGPLSPTSSSSASASATATATAAAAETPKRMGARGPSAVFDGLLPKLQSALSGGSGGSSSAGDETPVRTVRGRSVPARDRVLRVFGRAQGRRWAGRHLTWVGRACGGLRCGLLQELAPRIALSDLLRNAAAVGYFLEFMSQHQCADFLNFWLAVETYRNLDLAAVKQDDLLKDAQGLFKSYAGPLFGPSQDALPVLTRSSPAPSVVTDALSRACLHQVHSQRRRQEPHLQGDRRLGHTAARALPARDVARCPL